MGPTETTYSIVSTVHLPHIWIVIVLLLGPPGCGKGVQARFIASRFGIPAISTGELFRSECRTGTDLGRLACAILSGGGLVEDEVVNAILARRISLPEFWPGFLLDGYPRTLPQAQFLDHTLKQRGSDPVVSIHLDVPFPLIVKRIASRRQCPRCSHIYNVLYQPPKAAGVCDSDRTALVTREDDREDIIWQRLKVFDEQTGPVILHYAKSQYYRIDGALAPAEVSARIEAVLNDCAVPEPAGVNRRRRR
jgi:adenylate kinase